MAIELDTERKVVSYLQEIEVNSGEKHRDFTSRTLNSQDSCKAEETRLFFFFFISWTQYRDFTVREENWGNIHQSEAYYKQLNINKEYAL